MGGVGRDLGGLGDDPPDVAQSTELPERHELGGSVAEGGRLDGAAVHRHADGVRGELGQQGVVGAAADDVDARDPVAGDVVEVLGNVAVAEGERVEDAADDLGHALGDHGSRSRAVVLDARRRVVAVEELGGVAVDDAAQAGHRAGERDELGVGVDGALRRPVASAGLEQPQTGDVAQQPDRPGIPALVGDVGPAGAVGDDRLGDLDADEGPGARGDVERARVAHRCRDDGAGRVVARGDDDAGPGQPAVGEVGQQRPDVGAGRHDLGQEVGGDAEVVEQIGRPDAPGHVVEPGRRGGGVFRDPRG